MVDDGVGLPPDFTVEESSGLGLSIVQALVTTELGGSIELHGDDGTRVHLEIPLPATGAGRRSDACASVDQLA